MRIRKYLFRPILNLLKELVMTTQEAVDKIQALDATALALNDTLTKVGGEINGIGTTITALQASVADLTIQLANAGLNVPQSVTDALAKVETDLGAVAAKGKALDDMTPDTPPTP